MTNGGDVTVYPVDPQSRPSIITAGPDGAMWFTRTGDDRIGRITTAGELTAFELAEGSGPFGITAGADGALWFTAMTSGDIGRISVDGELSGWPSVGGAPSMIVTGPDNALWFTLNQGNAVGRLAPAEGITVRELPTAGAGPVGIAATHDDACGSPRSSPTSSAASRWTSRSRKWTCRANRTPWSPIPTMAYG